LPSIVEQIQRDALDNSVSVSALLRRVKLAAVKLGLGAVEEWVEKELNGCTSPVPDYRVLRGTPIARNPYTGCHPMGGAVDALRKLPNGQPIAVIEDLVADVNDEREGSFCAEYSESVCRRLDKMNDVAGEGWKWALEVPRSSFVGILDRVRTLVLDWAINLERAGVRGSEFDFDATERRKAREVGMTIIKIGSIGTFTGNLGSGNVSGDIGATEIGVAQIRDVLAQIKQHADELAAGGADRVMLEERIADLQAEMAKVLPDQSLVRGFLTDIRNILVGAAGNLVASGAIQVLNQMLGTGVPVP
jgi:hypothetical protein